MGWGNWSAAVAGLGYFLAAAFSVRLVLEPEGVAVFWPAAGLSSGLLIALDYATMAGAGRRDSRDCCDPLIIRDPFGQASPWAYATGQKP